MNLNRRLFLGGVAALAATSAPIFAETFNVPNGAIWFHPNNLVHNARMQRALQNDERPADVADEVKMNDGRFPIHQGLITSAIFGYNLRTVPTGIKAWHQPGGAELNAYTLPTQEAQTAPVLSGKIRAQAGWVFQTAGEIATLEFNIYDFIVNDDPIKGTYFILCRTAGPELMYPDQKKYGGLHVTSSLLKWSLRPGAPRRVVLPRSFA